MKILGIETSCDETAIAVIETNDGKTKVLSNIVSSQVKIHVPYGGVVPLLAAREHEKNLRPVFEKALKKSRLYQGSPTSLKLRRALREIDIIAVTVGPGLEIALWKGVNFAKALARLFKKPVIPVNHLEGHIYSNWLKPIREFSILNLKFSKKIFPALNLIVSGGHTQLVLMTGHGKYKLIGETLDDAAGEAFDKVAKMLKLGYPGGPIISKLAERGNPGKFPFPRPMLNQKNYNFSFSGLKTAVLYLLKEIYVLRSDSTEKRKLKIKKLNQKLRADISASFQQAVVDVLVAKTIKAAKEYKVKSILLSGGVGANKLLRKTLKKESKKLGIFYSQPALKYTTDNAAMIAIAGYNKFRIKKQELRIKELKANPNLKIKNW